jgi:hypothetical protein
LLDEKKSIPFKKLKPKYKITMAEIINRPTFTSFENFILNACLRNR